MITDRIGRKNVLLQINHNHYNFREKLIHLFEKGLLIPIMIISVIRDFQEFENFSELENCKEPLRNNGISRNSGNIP